VTEALGSHHRDTLRRLLGHPASGNIEWHQVKSLLEAVATVSEEHDGALRVTLGSETEVFHRPHRKDIDKQTIVNLRRMLMRAGYSADD
jgi:hypothetical protein